MIPIPVDSEEPYVAADTELLIGSTTKFFVLGRYGEPAAKYAHGSKFVYSDFKTNWEIPYLLPTAAAGASVGVGTTGERHYLILEFDEQDILAAQRVEIGKGKLGRSPSGICRYGNADNGHILWLADKAEEKRVKKFPVSGKQCGIYLYFDGYRFSEQISVALNGENLGQVNSMGASFYYLPVDPGRHALTADRIAPKPDSVMLQLTCEHKENIFVRLNLKGADSFAELFELVESSKGRRKVKARRLIIPQSAQ